MTSALSAPDIAGLFTQIGRELASIGDGGAILDAVVQLAMERVHGAEHAGVTIGRSGDRFQTVSPTDELVLKSDQIQYELRSGPCVDAVITDSTFNAADLRTDPRWPEFGRRCVEETGIVSMLATRLFVEADHGLIAGLNLYAHGPAAFDKNSEAVMQLLATHGSLAVGKATAQAKSRNLEHALESSREIGTAMGILMAQAKLTREQAFDLLRIASQRTHRKLRDVAADLVETGVLPGGIFHAKR